MMEKKRSKAKRWHVVDICLIAVAIGLVLLGSAILTLTMLTSEPWKVALCWVGFGLCMALALLLILAGLILESKVGYFQCGKCGHNHVPKTWRVVLSFHYGADRYTKCPKCGQRSWNKKIWTDENPQQ